MEMVSSIGWRLVDLFQDPGSSSENLARPEMQRLMACAELGQFEHLVVYAVDRLTRRLFDFARLMELLDKSGVKLTVVTDPHFGEYPVFGVTANEQLKFVVFRRFNHVATFLYRAISDVKYANHHTWCLPAGDISGQNLASSKEQGRSKAQVNL